MTECKHRYESVVRKVQEWKKNYTKDSNYDYQVLNQEEMIIFCQKCGSSKDLCTVDLSEKK